MFQSSKITFTTAEEGEEEEDHFEKLMKKSNEIGSNETAPGSPTKKDETLNSSKKREKRENINSIIKYNKIKHQT